MEEIISKEELNKLPKVVDVIFHTASQLLGNNNENLTSYFKNNVETTYNLLEYSIKSKIKLFVHSSTGSVYGNLSEIARVTTAGNPLSFYGLTKYFSDCLVKMYSEKHNLKSVVLRYPIIYGREESRSIAYRYYKMAKEGKTICLNKIIGQKYRNLVYIKDVVDINIKLLNKFKKFPRYLLFLIACENSEKILDIIKDIIKHTNSKSKIELTDELSTEINNCKKCELWKTRNKPLVGDGSVDVKILVVGESPGYNEDLAGKAFVGEAGKVLDQLLGLANLRRDKVYITNILKCHPPKNHNPNRDEINSCTGYLDRQIRTIKPRIIITLGKYASKEIFAKFNLQFSRISELHGKVFEVEIGFGKIKIIPLYHPAVACYHNEMIDMLKEDFRKLKDIL